MRDSMKSLFLALMLFVLPGFAVAAIDIGPGYSNSTAIDHAVILSRDAVILDQATIAGPDSETKWLSTATTPIDKRIPSATTRAVAFVSDTGVNVSIGWRRPLLIDH